MPEEVSAEEENEETMEAAEEEMEAAEVRRATAFFSADAVLMFPIALVLDLVGLVLVLFALDDFFITDAIGVLTIGSLIYMRSQTLKVTSGTEKKLKVKVAKWAKRLRWLRPLFIILEFIPYVGAAPCWLLLVYFELKYS